MAMAILSIFTLAIVMVLSKGLAMDRRDAVVTQSTMFCNEVMDQCARAATDPTQFDHLPARGYTLFPDQQEYIYSVGVSDFADNIKRIRATVYAQDPLQSSATPDPNKPDGACLVRMSTLVSRPTVPRPPQ